MNEIPRCDNAVGGAADARPVPPQYPYPAAMPVARDVPNHWPAWRIVDLVATIALFVVYAVGVLGLLYVSIFWVMATDSCGANDCDYGKLGTAYVLNDLIGIIVYVVALVAAVILVVRRRPAFWLPLVGGAVQVGLLLAALSQLSGVASA